MLARGILARGIDRLDGSVSALVNWGRAVRDGGAGLLLVAETAEQLLPGTAGLDARGRRRARGRYGRHAHRRCTGLLALLLEAAGARVARQHQATEQRGQSQSRHSSSHGLVSQLSLTAVVPPVRSDESESG